MTAQSIPLLLATLLTSLAISPAASAQGGGDIAVVVNLGNPVSNLSLIELRKIFAGEKRSWPGGIPIKLIVRAQGSPEWLALLRLLQMSEMEYKQYWTVRTLRGEGGTAPVAVPSVGIQREAVMTFRGAITLVNASDVKPGMKVAKLEGHLPGEPGYLLH